MGYKIVFYLSPGFFVVDCAARYRSPCSLLVKCLRDFGHYRRAEGSYADVPPSRRLRKASTEVTYSHSPVPLDGLLI